MEFTEKDREILDTLCIRVRILSVEQIARTWFGEARNPGSAARRRLKELEGIRFVEKREVLAHPLLDLKKPIFDWEPGEYVLGSGPNFAALAAELRNRWSDRKPELRTVWKPTETAKNSFGGAAEMSPLGQETHDLQLSELYLRTRGLEPERASQWRGEDCYASERRGRKRPDAELIDPATRQTWCVIEMGGRYEALHLEHLYQDCVERQTRFELW